MNIHYIPPAILYLFYEFCRLYYHQMYVERFLGELFYIFQNRESERYVGNEYAVHYVYVQPFRFTAVYHFYRRSEVAEIGREQRG